MTRKSVLALGFELPSIEGFKTTSFGGNDSLLDPDIVAAELTLDTFHVEGSYDGLPLLTKTSSYHLRSFLQSWHIHITEALAAGKTVVFFLTNKKDQFYYSGKQTVFGAGRNEKTREEVCRVSNYDFLPVPLKNTIYARGHSMILTDPGNVLTGIWAEF